MEEQKMADPVVVLVVSPEVARFVLEHFASWCSDGAKGVMCEQVSTNFLQTYVALRGSPVVNCVSVGTIPTNILPEHFSLSATWSL
jgi:hypothetical protein